MRVAMLATGVMNLGAAAGFAPPAHAVRAAAGLPEAEHSLYLAMVALFVGLFGAGYLWCGLTGRAERLFIALAAVGKIAFVLIVVDLWTQGGLPATAPLTASPDLVFGGLFVAWLWQDGASLTRVIARP
jgi:hypothetical protein